MTIQPYKKEERRVRKLSKVLYASFPVQPQQAKSNLFSQAVYNIHNLLTQFISSLHG